MRFLKLPRSLRQLSSYVLAIALGVLLTVSTLQVLPSQAEPAPIVIAKDTSQVNTQRQSPATDCDR